ncbi:MAG: heavy metal translocating P-type ATPase [Luteimonas sp.]
MNMEAAARSFGATAGDEARAAGFACYHCGESDEVAIESPIGGVSRLFCCHGCAAAAQWVHDADLDEYYRLRSRHAARVGTDAVDVAAWDREDVLAGHARAVEGGREITLLTDGMRCAACAWLIDRALSRQDGVLDVSANAVTGRIHIAWDPARTPLSRPLASLVALGFRPYLASGEERERARRQERNRWLLRLGVAGLGAMQAMMFAEALYFDSARQMPLPTRDFLRWVAFLAATPVVFYSGWPFLAGAWRELQQRRPAMDVLVAGSVLLVYFASLVETLRGGAQVWFDTAVMFVFLLLLGRILEQRARAIASAQVDALARARPMLATRERKDGTRESIPTTSLAVDDIACAVAGEVLPADGLLLDASAQFEEALLTGESRPIEKHAGDRVLAGTVSRNRPVRIRVTDVGSATRLSQLAALVERAQAHRPRLALLADRVANGFVFGLVLLATATWIGWHALQPERAFEVTLALLVISCPCALSLSVPAVQAVAHGALARIGVLAVRPDALERLAGVTDVVFDKTGTLSDGVPRLGAITTFDGFDPAQALAIACALERGSGHPLASAFDAASPAECVGPVDVETVAGAGISARVAGVAWRLGRAGFAAMRDDDEGVWLGDGVRALARFEIHESTRTDAGAAAAALRDLGMTLHLCSGDAISAVARVAESVGITEAHARQSPEDKLALVGTLQARGCRVAMVGDGINDAPVLAGADISIAIGSGAALARSAADLVLTGDSLARIPQAITLARHSQRIIAQNLTWAVAYNVVAIPLAATGRVTPWVAALGMALSSLTVTANALRLARRTT